MHHGGMNRLIVPGGYVPTNLRLPPGVEARALDDDMYDICARLREVDSTLYVVVIPEDDKPFAVMEACADGISRLVFKVEKLDARVIDKLRRLMSLSLHERLDEIEKAEREFERIQHEDELDRLYETMGRPMLTQLAKDGFVDSRPTSYPKLGVAAPGRSR